MISPAILNTGLLLSILGGLIFWLKNLPEQIIKKIKQQVVYNVTVYDSDELFYLFEAWLFKNHNNKYKDVEAGYFLDTERQSPVSNSRQNLRTLTYRHNQNTFVITYQGKKLFIAKDKQKLEHISDKRNLFSNHYSISGYKAKAVIQALLSEITSEFNASLEDNRVTFFVFVSSYWEVASRRLVKPLSKVVMGKGTKDEIKRDLEDFMNTKAWYIENNILYKRSYLFYGPPGTGKTTTAFALASESHRNIYVLNLNSVSSDDQLQRAFSSIPEESVLLIEDVDAAFIYRDNKKESKISFSCLLNCLDGSTAKEGTIIILTTNHIEKLDPALIRDGRVDVKISIPNAGTAEVSEYLRLFYGRSFDISSFDLDVPMSSVQEKCLQNKKNPEMAIQQIGVINKLMKAV